MRYNYPLIATMVMGTVFWAVLIIALWNSAGCSVETPC